MIDVIIQYIENLNIAYGTYRIRPCKCYNINIKTMDNNQEQSQKIIETSKKIKEIYNNTINKIKALEQEEKKVINDYIKKLEQKEVEHIRKKLLLG